MPGPLTTTDLIDMVRDGLDERDTTRITDDDLLQALNRAQRKATDILAKDCVDLLLDYTTTTAAGGTDTFDVPAAAFGRRLEHVVVVRNTSGQTVEYPLRRVPYRTLYQYTVTNNVAVPTVYALKGKSFIVRPTPVAGVVLKMWYPKAAETLVKPQGRITSINTGNVTLLLDALGTGLSTSTADLTAFVNIVDQFTGTIKATLQVASLTTSTNQVAFKTSGLTYSSIYNRTVATAFPTTNAPAVNDYVCAVQGTCVPDLWEATLDYLIQYAVVEGKRRLGESIQEEMQSLNDLGAELKASWVGREAVGRITNRSRSWSR